MQFSLFGAEAAVPVLADLDGVLLGGGHWLAAGERARLSVVVADPWRVDALRDAFMSLGVADLEPLAPGVGPLAPDVGPLAPHVGPRAPHVGPRVPGDVLVARTAMTERLRAIELRWRRGANEAPPAGLMLGAAGLRLWAVTAGCADEAGYVLRTPPGGGQIHRVAGALLARTGIAAVELGTRGGPGWRVTSARRLRRLAELVGSPPPGAEADWPRVEASPVRRSYGPS